MVRMEENTSISFLKNVTTTEEVEFPICNENTVLLTKQAIGSECNVHHSWIKMIFSGKQLQDQDLIGAYNIKSGVKVWVLIRQAALGQTQSVAPQPQQTTTQPETKT